MSNFEHTASCSIWGSHGDVSLDCGHPLNGYICKQCLSFRGCRDFNLFTAVIECVQFHGHTIKLTWFDHDLCGMYWIYNILNLFVSFCHLSGIGELVISYFGHSITEISIYIDHLSSLTCYCSWITTSIKHKGFF